MEENQAVAFDEIKDKEVVELLKSATNTPTKKAMFVGLLYGLEMKLETQVEQEKNA